MVSDMVSSRLSVTLIAALVAKAPAAAEPDLEPVRRWLERQAEVRSLAVEFVQERRLRAVKRPISNPGRLWFKAPGAFRWELGDPAQTIALQKPDGDLWVLRTRKAQARRHSRGELEARGGGEVAGFLESGFPRSYEAFVERFTVTDVRREGGDFVFVGRPSDRRTSVALRKVEFTVDASSFALRQLYLRFRDTSSITTKFKEPREGVAIDDRLFEVDLEGYEVVGE